MEKTQEPKRIEETPNKISEIDDDKGKGLPSLSSLCARVHGKECFDLLSNIEFNVWFTQKLS